MFKPDNKLIRRWINRNSSHFVYKPFPGRNPVRLFLEERWLSGLGSTASPLGRRTFFYNGKYNSGVYLDFYLRYMDHLNVGDNVASSVVLYCQSGILYRGSPIRGQYHRNYNAAFSGLLAPDTRQNRSAAPPTRPVTPLKIGSLWTLCYDELPPVGTPEYDTVFHAIRNNYLQSNGGPRASVQERS
jgi:hypothetical protein